MDTDSPQYRFPARRGWFVGLVVAVAAVVILAALATPSSRGHTFQVIGGKTAVLDAVQKESAKPVPDIKPTKKE